MHVKLVVRCLPQSLNEDTFTKTLTDAGVAVDGSAGWKLAYFETGSSRSVLPLTRPVPRYPTADWKRRPYCGRYGEERSAAAYIDAASPDKAEAFMASVFPLRFPETRGAYRDAAGGGRQYVAYPPRICASTSSSRGRRGTDAGCRRGGAEPTNSAPHAKRPRHRQSEPGSTF